MYMGELELLPSAFTPGRAQLKFKLPLLKKKAAVRRTTLLHSISDVDSIFTSSKTVDLVPLVVVEVLKKSSGRFNYAISKSIVIVAREALSSPELSTFWFGGSEPLKPIRTSTEDEELKAWKALPYWFSRLSFAFTRDILDSKDRRGLFQGWLTTISVEAFCKWAASQSGGACGTDTSLDASRPRSIILASWHSEGLTRMGAAAWAASPKHKQEAYGERLSKAEVIYNVWNLSNAHWALIKIDVAQNILHIFDPAGMVTAANVQDLPKFLALVTGDGKFRALKIIEHSPKADRYPAQTDNSSCGVFALAALMHLLRGARINFKQADMAEWRSFVAAKIYAMRTEGE